MQTIRRILVHNENILIIDTDNKLWIMGDNLGRKTGFGEKNNPLYSPIFMGIILDQNDTVKRFYSYEHLLAIFTVQGKLYVSRNNLTTDIRERRHPEVRPCIPDNDLEYPCHPEVRTCVDNELECPYSDCESSEDENDSQFNYSDPICCGDSNEENRNTFNNFPSIFRLTTIAMDSITEALNGGSVQNIVTEIMDNVFNNASDNDDQSLTNYDYFRQIRQPCCYGHNQRKPSEPGVDLIEDGIDQVTFTLETIYFLKNGKIYFYNQNIKPKSMILTKKLGLSVISNREKPSCYQLVFPFDIDDIHFGENFVHLRSGQYNHILSANSSCEQKSEKLVSYIYFKLNRIDKIYYKHLENSVYVRSGNDMLKYYHQDHNLKRLADNDRSFITSDITLGCLKDDGLYLETPKSTVLKKEVNYDELLEFFVDTDIIQNEYFILIDNPNMVERYIVKGLNLYFNVHGLTFYHFSASINGFGLLYYDINNTLYHISDLAVEEHESGTIEIDKLVVNEDTYYIYMFKDFPDKIINLSFTNYLVIVQTEDKYYYHTINAHFRGSFKVDKFTEIVIKSDLNDVQLVTKHHIVRSKKVFKHNVNLTVNTTSDKLDKLLNIIEMLGENTNFDICYKDWKIISYGNGPKREFMDSAIFQFSERYLKKNNLCVMFNLNEIANLSEHQLFNIGQMLHLVICHSNNHLPIRLPLTLIAAIAGKEPSIIELEYFSRIEDPDIFDMVRQYKDKPESLKDFCSDTYEGYLKFLCKYYHDTHIDQEMKINKVIATGFKNYNVIKNLEIMNLPTLDYFLSGDYKLDRELLISSLNVRDETKGDIDYHQIITEYIKTLPEDKLIILLKNWSGSSIVKKSCKYGITITHKQKGDIYFGTCDVNIIIADRLIKNPESRSLLLDLLTTPLLTMVDN